ncbi:MAG: hypothetical protein PHC41_11370 [Lachnospiraceae bacterium]|nr:hypothetical protein [Lachnospiraceae bacterium]MDD3616807.1 hypothetical protein [Lachnospiraceae bacterium]
MGVKASPEAIREMKKDIQNTIKDIEYISDGIRNGASASGNWNDDKATEFNLLMQKIARLTEQPVDTLKAALPKLEKLAQSLDKYNSTGF